MDIRGDVAESRAGGTGQLLHPAWTAAALLLLAVSTLFAWWQPPYPDAFARKSWIATLIYPVEDNPVARLPGLGAIRDAALAADGVTGVAVGDGLYRTTDGGLSWHSVFGGAFFDAVALSSDGTHGVAVGFRVTATTADSGRSWRIVKHRSAVRSVALSADGKRGIAIANAQAASTDDGGLSWRQAPPQQVPLSTVSVSADGLRGIANGSDDSVFLTQDGGKSWQPGQPALRFPSIAMAADGQHGVAASSAGLARTEDGGRSWTPSRSIGAFHDISLSADGLNGIAIADNKAAWTNDGGVTWHEVPLKRPLSWVRLSADGKRGLAGSPKMFDLGLGDGSLALTEDGGRSWRPIAHSPQIISVSLSSSGERGLALDDQGTLLRTTNGSAWHYLPQPDEVASVALAADGEHGLATGSRGWIALTADGGSTWQRPAQTYQFKNAVLSKDGKHGFATTAQRNVVRTEDGGQTWKPSPVAAAPLGLALSADGIHGFLVAQPNSLDRSKARSAWRTENAGRNWTPVQSTNAFESVALSDNGIRGLATSYDGVAYTENGGQTWATVGQVTGAISSALSADGESGVAVGLGIARTGDGGHSWQSVTDKGSFRSVALSSDGRTGVAVGTAAFVRTEDGGTTWIDSWPTYHRYPAPWYYGSLILVALLMVQAARRATLPSEEGAAALAASDAPITSQDSDRLNFAPLARGISRFLRNPRTDPPLTIAINGDWGMGKSSLMELVKADLRSHGLRPVWFNAWHHQQEEQLLSALLGVIRDTGLPPFLSIDGLRYRFVLLWKRSKRNYGIAAVAIGVIGLLIGFAMHHHDLDYWAELLRFVHDYIDQEGAGKAPPPDALGISKLIAQLIAFAVAATALSKSVKAFGVDPAVLLTETVSRFRLKDASQQSNFRTRFATDFREVTEALPYRMVIIVDDLDRCRPETVLNVMESVNFLISSGRCFILFGMARSRVQAGLALSFKDIAKELVELDLPEQDGGEAASLERRERARRHRYASDYLEKLINIEIQVPDQRDGSLAALLVTRTDDDDGVAKPGWMRRTGPAVGRQALRMAYAARRNAALVPMCIMLVLGLWAGSALKMDLAPRIDPVAASPALAAPSPPKAGGTGLPKASESKPYPRLLPPVASSFRAGDSDDAATSWYPILLGLLLLGFIPLMIRQLMRETKQVLDTRAFTDALQAWSPAVAESRASPRALKRFGNRVRYLAMLQQAERQDERWDEWLVRRWKALTMTAAPAGSAPLAEVLAEHRIVALGALHEIYGEDWQRVFHPHGPADTRYDPTDHFIIGSKIDAAIDAYRQATGAAWPPSPAERRAFERTLKGVRLAGDVSVIKS